MLATMDLCQRSALRIRNALPKRQDVPLFIGWKEFTLILISYRECGYGEEAEAFLLEMIKAMSNPKNNEADQFILALLELRELARSLAADRATKFLPIVWSQFTFIVIFILSFWRTQSEPIGPENWVQLEAHSIASSVMFLWLTPAVFLSALIGVSQTELAIPRHLNTSRLRLRHMNLHSDLLEKLPDEIELPEIELPEIELPEIELPEIELPEIELPGEIELDLDDDSKNDTKNTTRRLCTMTRIESGGLYSWRPDLQNGLNCNSRYLFVSLFLVGLDFSIAVIISATVPPEGFTVRHIGKIITCMIWVLSGLGNFAIRPLGIKAKYRYTFAKDIVAVLGIITIILLTQAGIYNSCYAWTKFGRVPLMFPQLHIYAETIYSRIKPTGLWPMITYSGIAIQLVFCFVTTVWYLLAVKVYLQRDDGKSNLPFKWLIRGCERLQSLSEWLSRRTNDHRREGQSRQTISSSPHTDGSNTGSV
ncbi:hypothetical protein BGZ57DRAFT_361747 [Hyaloscypha finlandica]|nr:hypothetical protein BGZ57DRAFT_361747 [Hyaloscypha finlandica]